MSEDSISLEADLSPITELPKAHRRVLGVLVEKAFTTPEYYPLTLKAVTTGCNQKSNRHPVVSYSEDDVLDVLDELREKGLAAVVHTESGRTERFRHYMRKRFTFTERQLAIMTELLLRGRQSMGELRTRVSRMVAIETLGDLRQELRGLMELNNVQANGPLERRGIEIDHNWYLPSENMTIPNATDLATSSDSDQSHIQTATTPTIQKPVEAQRDQVNEQLAELQSVTQQLQLDNQHLRDEIDALKLEHQRLQEEFDRMRQDLGG